MTRALAARRAVGPGVGVGTGLTALVLGATVANRWFEQRRGLVVGHAHRQLGDRAAGLPADRRVADPALRLAHGARDPGLRELPGRRAAWRLPDARPADGPRPARRSAQTRRTSTPAPPRPGVPASRRRSARCSWPRAAARSGCCSARSSSAALSTNGLIQTHFITLCGDYGLGPVPAASVLATMGVFDFVGTIGSGWLSDRYDNRRLLFWYYGLRGLSLLWLPHFTVHRLRPVAVRRVLRARLDRDRAADRQADRGRFGSERAGMIFGWIFAGHQLGARPRPTARAIRASSSPPICRPSSSPARCACWPRCS